MYLHRAGLSVCHQIPIYIRTQSLYTISAALSHLRFAKVTVADQITSPQVDFMIVLNTNALDGWVQLAGLIKQYINYTTSATSQ